MWQFLEKIFQKFLCFVPILFSKILFWGKLLGELTLWWLFWQVLPSSSVFKGPSLDRRLKQAHFPRKCLARIAAPLHLTLLPYYCAVSKELYHNCDVHRWWGEGSFLSTGVVMCESIRKQGQVLCLGLIWTRLGYYAKGAFEANKSDNNTNSHSLTPRASRSCLFFPGRKAHLSDRHATTHRRFCGAQNDCLFRAGKRSLSDANQYFDLFMKKNLV